MSEEDLEGHIEGLVMTSVLDQGCSQRRLERRSLTDVDVFHRLHSVDRFHHGDRDAGGAQLTDEVGEQVDHSEAALTVAPSSFDAFSMSV